MTESLKGSHQTDTKVVGVPLNGYGEVPIAVRGHVGDSLMNEVGDGCKGCPVAVGVISALISRVNTLDGLAYLTCDHQQQDGAGEGVPDYPVISAHSKDGTRVQSPDVLCQIKHVVKGYRVCP